MLRLARSRRPVSHLEWKDIRWDPLPRHFRFVVRGGDVGGGGGEDGGGDGGGDGDGDRGGDEGGLGG